MSQRVLLGATHFTRYDLLDLRTGDLGMGIGRWDMLHMLTDALVARAQRRASSDHMTEDPYVRTVDNLTWDLLRMRDRRRWPAPDALPWSQCVIVGCTAPDPICPHDIMLISVRYAEHACAGYGVDGRTGELHIYWD